jgi:hypothetical protein
MINPSPIQQAPATETLNPSQEEKRRERSTYIKKRTGESPVALRTKAVLRPIFKCAYYLLNYIKKHRILATLTLILLVASIALTSFLATGWWPLGIGNDPVSYQLRDINGGGRIKTWLYAVRDGNTNSVQQIQANMQQPPDANQLVSQFRQASTHGWTSIKVLSTNTQEDTTIDTFVQVEFSSRGPSGTPDTRAVFHFLTVQGSEELYGVDIVTARRVIS